MGRQNQTKNYQRKGSVTDWELADQAVSRRALDASVAAAVETRFPVGAYGAVGDGTTDNAAAILACYAAIEAAGGGTMVFGPAAAPYYLGDVLMVVTVPLIIDLNGQRLSRNPGTIAKIRPPRITTALTVAAPVSPGTWSVTLGNASGVQSGDILVITEAVTTETAWSTPRTATVSVRSVSGNVVSLSTVCKMPFSVSATATQYRPPAQFGVRDGEILYRTTPNAGVVDRLLSLEGFRAPRLDNLTVSANQAWASGGPPGMGITLTSCVDAMVHKPKADRVAYGILIEGSLNTTVIGMGATNVRHPVVPTAWAVGVSVQGLTTDGAYQTIDSHPAFDVNYADVIALRDETFPNLRCIGGSIRNAKVYTEATDADSGPFFHSLDVVDTAWYDNAVLTLDKLEIVAPNVTTKRVIAAKRGHVVLNDVIANDGGSTAGTAKFDPTLRSLSMTNVRNPDGTPWGRSGIRKAPRVGDSANLPAYLDGSVWHINPWRTLKPSSSGVLRCFGRIITASTTDPQAITIAIHDNVFPDNDWTQDLFGAITLRAFVRHNNSGLFDVLTKTWHYYHKAKGTSDIAMPTTAAYADGLTGQTNESLAMTISNVSQQGATQLGTSFPDTLVQFDVAVSSGRTSPVYSLSYELELVAG